MKNTGHVSDKRSYNRPRLPGEHVVVHFKHNDSESASIMETLFNQIYE